MTSKTIIIGLVAIAFVAGSIMTGTIAEAKKEDKGDNLIVDALNNIATAISGINPNVTVDPTPITINAPQGEKGDKGETGADGAKGDQGDLGPAPQAFHLKGTSTSSGNVAVNGLSKTFTLSEATIVFVSSDVETKFSIPASQLVRAEIEIDGSVVSIGPVLDDDGLALMLFPSHVSWTGQLSAGTHTISTHVFTTVGGTVCPIIGHGCNMNILVLGQ